jgi:hypothetical protein
MALATMGLSTHPIAALGATEQTVRPSAVVAAAGWEAVPAGTLASVLADGDDVTVARSPLNSTATLRLTLAAGAPPVAGPITLVLRGRRTP